MKRILVLMLVAVAMLMFVSCENKAEEPAKAEKPAEVQPVTAEELIGEWRCGDDTEFYKFKFTATTVTKQEQNLNATAVGSSTFAGFYDATYKIENNVITITQTVGEETKEWKYSAVINGNNLTLTQVGEKSMFAVTGHENVKSVTVTKQNKDNS